MNALEKQVYIYSIGTECFYTDKEYAIHKRLLRCHLLKKKVKEHTQKPNISRLRKTSLRKRNKFITSEINNLKAQLQTEFANFEGVRELHQDTLTDNKIIGIFDSALSRTIGMKINEVSDALFVVRAFYFNILEDIICNGFTYKGEEYIYFSSSAGQIRTKKTVFIKKHLWDKHEKTLTCGLTLEDINAKGGCNVNKLLAYKALITSASVRWTDFDIDRAIVVPDLASPVTAEFDYIDRDTYDITRKDMSVEIEHTDGCGMILPSKSKKSFMTRLPYVKGLLVPFDFKKFAIESGNTKVKDIYGKEWDIVEDNIEVIFTKSQFKMVKYYADWDDYKDKFKAHQCHANKLNEEDIGGDVTLNYQMLQTLTDISDDEIKELVKATNEDVKEIHTDKHVILRILGATKGNKNKNYYQQGLLLYPELINDNHSKRIIKDKKNSMVNDARAGKLKINGKYLYIIPDLYAFCEFLFKGIMHPGGLLQGEQVYTNVFSEGKVDILRSPHLYKEHAVREIVKSEELAKWFITQGIYTSVHDPISRILQFDVDGDKALVIQDETLITVAERNMQGIVPLYYEMGVAEGKVIENKDIYSSLINAFKANIGEVSNNITKVFNSGEAIDLDIVKWLTAENNYIIDYAKTLYMPERPEHIDKQIRAAISCKVPYFFMEAKKKDKKLVEPINNSTMNRLRKFIPNPNLKLGDVAGTMDYTMLMSDKVERINRKVANKFKNLNKNKYRILRKSNIKDRKEGLLYAFKFIRDEMKTTGIPEDVIVNYLIKDIYDNRNSTHKDTLWNCYGDIIVSNLRTNLKNTKQCERCGIRIEVVNNKVKYCDDCAKIIKNEQNKKYYHLGK